MSTDGSAGIPAVEVVNMTAGYGSQDILKNVSFSLDENEFLGIIGPNGGGKTTLFKVLLGILKPRQGTVRIFGKDPAKTRQLVGYVPQYLQYDRQFPVQVLDVVLMGRLGKLGFKPFFTKQDREAALEALKQVNMEKYAKRQLSSLSGGQQQRVLIARALCTRPKVLLLDEPTASVDKKIQTSIYELLSELNKDMTILLVTHDIGVVSTHVKKIGCLNGYFIYHGSGQLTGEMLEAAYECPVDLIAHGVPHRVFPHDMPGDGGHEH
jgi:zinc transport system ATP-binding protein